MNRIRIALRTIALLAVVGSTFARASATPPILITPELKKAALGDVVKIVPHLAKTGGNQPLKPYGYYKREARIIARLLRSGHRHS
jgi:hypothetical protein